MWPRCLRSRQKLLPPGSHRTYARRDAGRFNPVFVYKLITEGTVEEKILALQARNKRLADNVYGKGKGGTDLPIDAETIGALLAGE